MDMMIIVIIVALIVSGIICGVMYAGMKPVGTSTQANNYISTGGVKLRTSNDQYLRTTESVRMLNTGNAGGNSASPNITVTAGKSAAPMNKGGRPGGPGGPGRGPAGRR